MSSKLTQALTSFDNQKCKNDTPLPTKACNYGIFGKKGCGKTSMLLALISKEASPWYKFFNLIFLISPTASRDDKLKDLVADLHAQGQYYNELNDVVLEDILDKIEVKKTKTKNKKKKKELRFLIIYDDCITQIKNCKLVGKLATQNRHYEIYNVYLLQKYNCFLPPLVRSNLDLISIFHSDNRKEIESFIEEIGYDQDILEKLYDFATKEQYSFLHINMYSLPIKFYKRFDLIEFKKS
jgi:hypothetical protein